MLGGLGLLQHSAGKYVLADVLPVMIWPCPDGWMNDAATIDTLFSLLTFCQYGPVPDPVDILPPSIRSFGTGQHRV